MGKKGRIKGLEKWKGQEWEKGGRLSVEKGGGSRDSKRGRVKGKKGEEGQECEKGG